MAPSPDRREARKLSPAEVAREALSAYRSHLGLLLLAAVAVFVPITLLEAAAHGLGELRPDEVDAAAIVELVAAALAVTITSVLGEVFYTGVVAAVVNEERTGLRHELAGIARGLPWGRLAAVDVLFVLAVAVGLVLLVVPGVIVFVWFALAAPAVKIEGLGVGAAFRRSRELVRGSFWRVFVILAPVLVAGDLLGELLVSSGPWILGHGFFGDWLGELLAQGLTAPFFALAAVVTAHHLIARAASPRTPPQ